MENIKACEELKQAFKKLPSIGDRTAQRLAYACLKMDKEDLDKFIRAFENVENNVHTCPRCGMYIDSSSCPICDDVSRDSSILIVVEDMKDVLSFERTNKFNGKYFILNGLISPLKGKDASSLHLDNLKKIIEEDRVKEVILATSSTLEGETTALYINRYLESMNIKISRLAYGLPIGADLEYVDGLTIERSLINRVDMKRG